ncbi:hypothetical protein [Marinomonas fungiae]|uniref:hypothetical protein n=1 Tax=Marinomonas fungiae TaxID=1137284 RepID=UPI003A8E7EB0
MQGNELYFFLGVVVVVWLFFFLKGNKRPPTNYFICARCNKTEQYSARTTEAWRRGFSKLYCQVCHKQWLNKNPKRKHDKSDSGQGGCLGVLVVLLLMPPTIFGAIWYVF